ncbi:MAG: Verru_Chthon cassette protein D [Chthoniobacteraceae bacterium]
MISRRFIDRNAFTLVELLVVIVIIGMISTLSLPSFQNVLRSSAMTSSGSQLLDYLSQGRQTAMTLNQPVRVWFYPGTTNDSVILYRSEGTVTGTVTTPANKELKLNGAVTLASNTVWSSVLSDAISGTPQTDPKYSKACYSFRFMPDGSTDLAGTASATLTLIYRTDSGKASLPSNFFTLQIDRQTGSVRTFRPQ